MKIILIKKASNKKREGEERVRGLRRGIFFFQKGRFKQKDTNLHPTRAKFRYHPVSINFFFYIFHLIYNRKMKMLTISL